MPEITLHPTLRGIARNDRRRNALFGCLFGCSLALTLVTAGCGLLGYFGFKKVAESMVTLPLRKGIDLALGDDARIEGVIAYTDSASGTVLLYGCMMTAQPAETAQQMEVAARGVELYEQAERKDLRSEEIVIDARHIPATRIESERADQVRLTEEIAVVQASNETGSVLVLAVGPADHYDEGILRSFLRSLPR
jgi:hypothetical protein